MINIQNEQDKIKISEILGEVVNSLISLEAQFILIFFKQKKNLWNGSVRAPF